MSIGSINPLSSYLQSLIASAIQGTGTTAGSTTNSPNAVDSSTQVTSSSDNTRLSPFAQMLAELQQLQQSDPAKYQQVTQQVASNLQSAAQTAQAGGNATAATQLNQLASDFTTASKNGQLPSVQDLAQALGAHHGHHHHHAASSSDSGSTSSAIDSTGTNQTLSQLLAAFQAGSTQSNALDPMSIIMNTLSSAGVTAS